MKTKCKIIYEDKEIIVVEKPAHLLTIKAPNKWAPTLYEQLSTYVKKQYPKNKIFIVHRLDKDTSGIILFAKNEKVKHLLQEQWESCVKKRLYYCIVEGCPKKKQDTIKTYLKESADFVVHSTEDKKYGKLAITSYKTLRNENKRSLLEIEIKTGRKNQIRAQLSEIGHPIVGDKKYGAKTNLYRRLMLHASKLEIIHPITKKVLSFESAPPKEFQLPK